MKITIDTFNKEISLESSESIKDIVDFMQKHFPEEWMNFKVKGNSIVVTIPYQEPFTYPVYPTYPNSPFYTYTTDGFGFWDQTFNTANRN